MKGDHLWVDFAGSSPQVNGAINSTFSFVKSSTYLAVRCALDRDVPNNAGVYRCITVTAPEGSILNPDMPAPVAARALTGYRVVDTVLGALAQIAPDQLMAAGEGGNTVVAIGGYDKQTGEPFVLVDMINGAWGGRADKDGIEAITNPAQNMSNLPVETHGGALSAADGGIFAASGFRRRRPFPRRPRAGAASIALLADDAVLQLRADRTATPPYGLFGGLPGSLSRNILNPDGENARASRQADTRRRQGHGDPSRAGGGGGNGDPLERALAAIASDLAEEKITPQYAARYHAVCFAADGSIDHAATEAERERLGAGREAGREI